MKLIETTTKQREPITIEFSPYEQDVLRGIVGMIYGSGPYRKVVSDLWGILENGGATSPEKGVLKDGKLVSEEYQVSPY